MYMRGFSDAVFQAQHILHRGPAHRVILETGFAHHLAVQAVTTVKDDGAVHGGGDFAERQGRVLRPIGQESDGIDAGGAGGS